MSALLVPLLASAVSAPQTPDDPVAIIGGAEVDPCAWPSAARSNVFGVGCGAALIHPRVVALTSFCVDFAGLSPEDDASFDLQFGYWAGNSESYEVSVPFSQCEFDEVFGVCVLDAPVPVPYAPPATGCETVHLEPGANVLIAGFGNIGTEENRAKRAGVMTVDSVFDDIFVAEGDVGPCAGDSGDATFQPMPDGSWRTVGIAAGQECGGVASILHLAPRVPWIEEVTGIDVTPCHDDLGLPDPGPECGGFFTGDADNHGTWPRLCNDAFVGGDGGVCSGDAVPPSVEWVVPADGSAYPDAPATVVAEISASDEGLGVRNVRLSINGEVQATERLVEPYAFELALPEGVWELAAVAQDWGGNEATSEPVTVVVGDPPPEGGDSSGGEPPPEEDGDTTGEEPVDGTSTTTGSPPTEPDDDGDTEAQAVSEAAGGCRVGGRSRGWLAALLLVAWTRRRRVR